MLICVRSRPIGTLATVVATVIAAVVATLVAGARPAAAQDHEFAPLILRLPASARYLAMGNSAMGSRDDDVLFYNPSQIAIARGMSVSGEQYSAAVRGGSLSSVTRFNTGGIAIGAQLLSGSTDASGYPLSRTGLDHPGGSTATSVELIAGIAQVYKSLRVGVAGKYVEDDVNGVRLGRGLADIGVSKDLFRGYTVGLALRDLGAHTELGGRSIDLPTRLSLGATGGQQAGPFDLLFTGDVSAMRGGWIAPAGGAELGYSWLDGYNVAFRAGARRPAAGEGPLTGGLGFSADRLSIDYAMESLRGGRVGHRIGLRVR